MSKSAMRALNCEFSYPGSNQPQSFSTTVPSPGATRSYRFRGAPIAWQDHSKVSGELVRRRDAETPSDIASGCC